MKKLSSSSCNHCNRCNHCEDRKNNRKKSTFFTVRNKQDFENNSLHEVNPQVSSTCTTSLENLLKQLKRPVATPLFTPPSSFTEIRKERKQNNKKTMDGIQKLFLFIDSPQISTTSIVNEFTQWTTKIPLMNKTMKKKLAQAMVKFFNERVITRQENKHHVRHLYEELELLLIEIEDCVQLSRIHKKHAMFLIANGDVKQGMAMLMENVQNEN